MESAEIARTMYVSGSESSPSALGGEAGDPSVDVALAQLEGVDEQLARSLAALHGAPDGVVAATVAAYRFGTRTLLNSMGLLENDEDRTGRLRVSERGKQVIEACAKRYPQPDTDVDAALRAASDLLSHAGGAARLKIK